MKTLLIIGANSDMAKSCARIYAAQGYDVILAVREYTQMKDFSKDLKIRYQCKASIVELDILEYENHEMFYDSIKTEVTGVIIATGYLGDQLLAQKSIDETLKIVNTNLTAVISVLNIIAEDFEKRGHGFIVVISSVAGERGRQKNYIYGTAKAGLSTYLSGLRNRLFKSGISVLTVKPGFVATKMTEHLDLPKQLTAQPDEIAQAIFRYQTKGRDVLFYPHKWRLIMLIIRLIPEKIFKRLDL